MGGVDARGGGIDPGHPCPQVFLALGELLLSCNWAVVADILLVGMGYMLVLALLSSLGIGKDFRGHGVGIKVTFHSFYRQNTSFQTLSSVSSIIPAHKHGGPERAGTWTKVTQWQSSEQGLPHRFSFLLCHTTSQ